jgi:hypothetical protein
MNGITSYSGMLRDDSFECRNDLSRIYVCPGRIYFHGKSYSSISDTVQPEASNKDAVLAEI